ncbi:hypothetical protein BD626DRAFT_482595 [Schizophyllum amplum]|uniref:F-box domain-containing protein n=1 Tax=Schizophyllum amplum TaxID=97359 RepID=A0A550CVD1_9AGAR|nr:hypothetical protein BD626DRAFT_482595 [Auriculariopsis ampla]
MSAAQSREPILPCELLDQICDLAAAVDKETRLSLSLASSRTRTIALNHLHTAPIIKTFAQQDKYLEALGFFPSGSTPVYRRSPVVRGLWDETISSHIIKMVGSFNCLRHLALHRDAFAWLIQAADRDLKLTARDPKLDLHLTLFRLDDALEGSATVFSLITTLHILSFRRQHDLQYIGRVRRAFPRLKGLAIPALPMDYTHCQSDIMSDTLSPLEMVVLVCPNEPLAIKPAFETWRRLRNEERHIHLVECSAERKDQCYSWETEVRGGESIWDRAAAYTTTLAKAYEQAGHA